MRRASEFGQVLVMSVSELLADADSRPGLKNRKSRVLRDLLFLARENRSCSEIVLEANAEQKYPERVLNM